MPKVKIHARYILISMILLLLLYIIAMPFDVLPVGRPFVGPVTQQQRLAQGWIDETGKYFHEAGKSNNLGHYDARFFKGEVDEVQRTLVLGQLIRSYLDFCEKHGIETWLAHGTLLGWWWNGIILPWDWDLDVQLSESSLTLMGSRFNHTTYHYLDPLTSMMHSYLLDVNAMIAERVPGNGMNIIDARWIDLESGLFVDITGLSETAPDASPGTVQCKHLHHYDLRDLYPLRHTRFEGVTARIPHAYSKLLIDEYQTKALVLTSYMG